MDQRVPLWTPEGRSGTALPTPSATHGALPRTPSGHPQNLCYRQAVSQNFAASQQASSKGLDEESHPAPSDQLFHPCPPASIPLPSGSAPRTRRPPPASLTRLLFPAAPDVCNPRELFAGPADSSVGNSPSEFSMLESRLWRRSALRPSERKASALRARPVAAAVGNPRSPGFR